MLAKSFAMECTEGLGVALESDEVPISRLDSTISYDEITAETIKKCDWDSIPVGVEVRLDTANDEAQLDLETGRIRTLEELEHVAPVQSLEVGKEENIPGRHSSAVRSRRSNAETLPERYLAQSFDTRALQSTITRIHRKGYNQS